MSCFAGKAWSDEQKNVSDVKEAMALSLLKRSDANLMLLAATEDPTGLAEHLSAQQAFTVEVFATFANLGWATPVLQQSLEDFHIRDGWFTAAPEELLKVLCKALPANGANTKKDVMEEELGLDAGNDFSDLRGASIEPAWHDFLRPCPKEQADKATVIRKALKEQLGALPAAALLGNYREAVLRLPGKGSQRFIVDCRGEAMQLALEGAGCQVALAA